MIILNPLTCGLKMVQKTHNLVFITLFQSTSSANNKCRSFFLLFVDMSRIVLCIAHRV